MPVSLFRAGVFFFPRGGEVHPLERPNVKAWDDGKEPTADAQAERSDFPCPLSRSPGMWQTSHRKVKEG